MLGTMSWHEKKEKIMIKGGALIIILFFSIGLLNAQYNAADDGLVSRFKPGIGWYFSGTKPYKEKKLRKYDRLIIDIVYNDWQGDREIFKTPWQSVGFNIALMADKVITKKNTFSIGYGLSFSHYNNKSNQSFVRNIQEGSTVLQPFDTADEISRNKFTANYLEVPLEFRFKTKGYKHFKFMVGGKIGFQLNSFTKTSQLVEGQRYTTRIYNFPDNNKLRYGATVRIGIRNWAIFGAYYFSELFTNKNSVQLSPVSMGISISLF